jgi:DNA-3-methyladenine glycosylase
MVLKNSTISTTGARVGHLGELASVRRVRAELELSRRENALRLGYFVRCSWSMSYGLHRLQSGWPIRFSDPSLQVAAFKTMPSTRAQRGIWPGKVLPRSFFHRPAPAVGPDLLNKVLASADGRSGRIVEVEAYVGAMDPAAHTFRGKTARNATMFGPPGHMYVYFTYGMHWCCNCVCESEGHGSGVLIRALEPLAGLERMREARPRISRDRELCRGPARLTQAMGITGVQDGIDLVKADAGFAILDDGTPPPLDLVGRRRIGISKAMDLPWRWYVPGSLYVSAIRSADL